jgi:L-seryl-tRNA(Ser) seleniumtransferase
MTDLRSLPSVDAIIESQIGVRWTADYGRSLTISIIRAVLDEIRSKFLEKQTPIPGKEDIYHRISDALSTAAAPTLHPVINASGVIIHTNLGRAPLSEDALQAVREAAGSYSSLEFDMEKGERGSRLIHAEKLLVRLVGSEGALVVNNNASAVLLVLRTFTRGQKVIIARSQLVEIGGGFRVPDVMRQSGALLHEVGATNKVHLFDYEDAIDGDTAAFLRAHRSNFALVGFTSEPTLEEISTLAHQHGILVIDDLGSGAVLDTAPFGLKHEPMVQESVAAGADLVCFSGDKLLGGPQAGIILGRGDLIDRLRKHPLARAIRADKMALAGLSSTLLHYIKEEAPQKIPVWRMISMPVESIKERALSWQAKLGTGEVLPAESTVGGGSLPGETLPTYALVLNVDHPHQFLGELRSGSPPVIGRIQDDRVFLDPRTVFPEQDQDLLNSLHPVINNQ